MPFDIEAGFAARVQGGEHGRQLVVQGLLAGGAAPRVVAGLLDESAGNGRHAALQQGQQPAGGQGRRARQGQHASGAVQFVDNGLVELGLEMQYAIHPRGRVDRAGQQHAATDQPRHGEVAGLRHAQQQRKLLPRHGVGHRQGQRLGRAGAPVHIAQVGVDQVGGVPGGAQRRLQGLGAELPPETAVAVPWAQPRLLQGGLAKAILAGVEEHKARAVHRLGALPEADSGVSTVEQPHHSLPTRKRSRRLSA